MKRPPLLMHIKFHGEERFGIWLPIFLLLPLALVLFIILLPLILIAVIVLWPSGWGRKAILFLRATLEIFYSLQGLKLDIKNKQQCVYISVI